MENFDFEIEDGLTLSDYAYEVDDMLSDSCCEIGF